MMVLRQPMNQQTSVTKIDTDSLSLPNLMADVSYANDCGGSVLEMDFNEKFNNLSQSSSNLNIPTSSSTMNLSMTEKTSRTNLYIKGLPEDFTDERLWDLVPDKGQVKSVKAATEDDNKCRGYGFIDFQSCESAQIALRHVQTHYPLFTIKFAKENEKDKTNLYVTNIPKSWTTKDSDKLKEVFEKFGQIQSAFVMVERSSNKSLGIGFVRFANEDDALNTIDTLRKNALILPTCSHPVEAKFADKHNPDTRRRKHQVMTSSNFGLNTAMLSSAGPLLSNFAFTPNNLTGFTNLQHQTHPSITTLSLNPMNAMNMGQGSSPTTPSVSNDTSNNLLNSLRVQSTSGQTHPNQTAAPFPSSAEQLSLIAAGFPMHNLYGLYGNQFYRPSSGNPQQHPGANAQNQTALTSAILASLNNSGGYNNPGNPYSTLVAYQALMGGAVTTNPSAMTMNSTSVYSGSGNQARNGRSNLFQTSSANHDQIAGLNPSNSDNIIQFQ